MNAMLSPLSSRLLTNLHLFFAFLVISFTSQLQAQILEPAKWSNKVEKVSETEVNLIFEARIDAGWHIYSQFTPENGPLPLEIEFIKEGNADYEVIGKATESKTKRQYSDIFEVDEVFFSDYLKLTQRVRILKPGLKEIRAKVSYQVCLDKCINAEKKFTFDLPKLQLQAIAAVTPDISENITGDSISVATPVKDSVATVSAAPTSENQPATPGAEEEKDLLSIFLIAFVSGFAALLTPCVFPLIPMTVSYFTKTSKNKVAGVRNAIIYGISIIVIYVVLGLLITGIWGAGALNSLATNVWFNLIFFILLMIFAMSFLGAFEIMLPNSWANKVDRQADRGGIIGILFMALALAIVSFSCTGIFVGNLLVYAATKGGIAPIVGMFGFSLALALPFMLFAMFPGWLNSLPKSGGWLNTVKVFLGFLELALAFKFLSNADLVLQLHLLEREVFIAIWIAIFGTLALYLFGKITLPHDSPLPSISVGRLLLGLLVLTFTVYLVPGLWGAPLKLVSAFPPPMSYSESPYGLGGRAEATAFPPGAKLGPHGLAMFTDYETGVAYAKTVNKPILLDFTGHACVNCRLMENNVWSDSKILPILREDIVLISLYVDDKRPLPEAQQTVSKVTGNDIETIGDKWTEFMITKYNTNTQPLYVLIDHEGNNLNKSAPTISYVGVAEYLKWLTEGIGNY